MEKIIMLGTGHGFVYNLYNTCFLLVNENENLLVDTGGGIERVKMLNEKGYLDYLARDMINHLIFIVIKKLLKQ